MNDAQNVDPLQVAHHQLLRWCREHEFAGHDPYDALNSALFQSTPFAKYRNARLLWTQFVKRFPADLRTISKTPRERNSKGIALFSLALLADHRRLRTTESAEAARTMLDSLLSMSIHGFSGAAWGYNFDWQSRNFFAPRGTPTIVPTAFAARALVEAANQFADERYLATVRSVCDFILNDLPRTVETPTEVCFSYAPDTKTQIFNASLLAAEVLAEVGIRTGDSNLINLSERATRYVVNRQLADGSWPYGVSPSQSWKDNFHTSYVLFSLSRINKALNLEQEAARALESGYQYWKKSFFLADGWPKYYHDNPYPADAHAGASAIITLLELEDRDPQASMLAETVARWTIRNLRDPRGYFYYQRRRFYTVRKPYIRWSQAWMLYALSLALEAQAKKRRT